MFGSQSSIKLFSKYVRDLKVDYLILSSSTPLYENIARQYFPYLIENTQTQAIYYKVFSKVQAQKAADEDVLFELPEQYRNPGKFPLPIDSLNEFPFAVKCDASKLQVPQGTVLLVKSFMRSSNETAAELESVISLTGANGQTFSYGARQVNDFLPGADSTTQLYSEQFLGTAFKKYRREATLNSYLWNKGHARSILLDQHYFLIDYWHSKWNFWE